MTNLNILKNTYAVVVDADKELLCGMPLYQVKSLFDGLVLADVIDFDSEYGELLQNVLDSKRKDVAQINIIRARSSLERIIQNAQQTILDSKAEEQEQDSLAIESTCEVIVSRNDKDLEFNDMPKKLGRPSTGKALTSAERSKRARDKKKANKLVTVNHTLTQEASALYNQMIESGYDLNSIVKMAHISAFIN